MIDESIGLASDLSLPVRGAWIEIVSISDRLASRESLPVRGAWIEIPILTVYVDGHKRRSPCGERGLKSPAAEKCFRPAGSRSPCGERGLKFRIFSISHHAAESLPVRGAWIEIILSGRTSPPLKGRSPCGERGLKLQGEQHPQHHPRRSPCGERGLKLRIHEAVRGQHRVAPRAGSVD